MKATTKRPGKVVNRIGLWLTPGKTGANTVSGELESGEMSIESEANLDQNVTRENKKEEFNRHQTM